MRFRLLSQLRRARAAVGVMAVAALGFVWEAGLPRLCAGGMGSVAHTTGSPPKVGAGHAHHPMERSASDVVGAELLEAADDTDCCPSKARLVASVAVGDSRGQAETGDGTADTHGIVDAGGTTDADDPAAVAAGGCCDGHSDHRCGACHHCGCGRLPPLAVTPPVGDLWLIGRGNDGFPEPGKPPSALWEPPVPVPIGARG